MACVENYGWQVYPTMEWFKADSWATVVPIANTTRPEITAGGLFVLRQRLTVSSGLFLATGLS